MGTLDGPAGNRTQQRPLHVGRYVGSVAIVLGFGVLRGSWGSGFNRIVLCKDLR